MIVKHRTDDFIVEEISNKYGIISEKNEYYFDSSKEGKFLICVLYKDNIDMGTAVDRIAKVLGVSHRRINFAGTKDKRAKTYQLISIYNYPVEKLIKNFRNSNRLKIFPLFYSDKKVHLGDLKGNRFRIVVRKISKEEIPILEENIKKFKEEENKRFPNYYGVQRFGDGPVSSHIVGKHLIKREYCDAIKKIFENSTGKPIKDIKNIDDLMKIKVFSSYELKIKEYLLHHNLKDCLGALKSLPPFVTSIYLHAYQSYIFNKTLDYIIDNNIKKESITIPGYDEDLAEVDEVDEYIISLMQEDKIDTSMMYFPEFKIKLRSLSRSVYSEAKNFRVYYIKEDDAFEGYYKIKIGFDLPKGSYATVLLAHLFKNIR